MKRLILFLICLPLLGADGYLIVARTGAAATACRNYIENKTDWSLAGTGAENLAQPAYLLSDGTNQVTVRAYYMHVWHSQTTAAARQKFAELAATYPGQFAWFPTTNGIVNTDALLASLPVPLASKVSTGIIQ